MKSLRNTIGDTGLSHALSKFGIHLAFLGDNINAEKGQRQGHCSQKIRRINLINVADALYSTYKLGGGDFYVFSKCCSIMATQALRAFCKKHALLRVTSHLITITIARRSGTALPRSWTRT